MRFKEFSEAITPPEGETFAMKVYRAMQAADQDYTPSSSPADTTDASTSAPAGPVNTKITAGGNYLAFKEPGFKAALEKTASNLGIDPNHLIAIMKQESGLNPKARNPSGATGLIQFMPKTARGLGTSTDAIYNMSATEQLPWVEKYFKSVGIRPGASLGDLYVAVFYPAAMNKGDSHVISKSGNAVYNQNKGLDRNRDGVLTVADVKNSVARYA